MIFRRILAVVIVCAAFARAQSTLPAQQSALPDFHQGQWTGELYFGYAREFYPNDHVNPWIATAGVGYYFRDRFSIDLELPVYYVNQPLGNAPAVGLNLLLRQHLLVRENYSIYIDVAGGMFEADRRVPPGGTDFNWTIAPGIGATYKLDDHVHLMGGARYFHLSNAALESPARNPDLNAFEAYVGLLFLF